MDQNITPYLRAAAIGIVAIAVGFGLLQPQGNAASAAEATQSKRLTCSFIASRCTRKCSAQAPQSFCKSYCADERRQCLRTGKWSGMVRTFSNVRKK